MSGNGLKQQIAGADSLDMDFGGKEAFGGQDNSVGFIGTWSFRSVGDWWYQRSLRHTMK
jgi:hypothetical protein